MKTILYIIPFLFVACGTVVENNQSGERLPFTLALIESRVTESSTDPKTEQEIVELKFKTNFPSGTKVIYSVTENRDAVRPPLAREVADTLTVTDSIMRWTIAPALLPASLMISIPETMQPEDVKSAITAGKVTHESEMYCPHSLFCRSYLLEFTQQSLRIDEDTLRLNKLPLEISFRESLMK